MPDPTTLLCWEALSSLFTQNERLAERKELWVCERGRERQSECAREPQRIEDSAEVGADSMIEGNTENGMNVGWKKKAKNHKSSRDLKTPGCVITWVVHVVHLAVVGELLVSNAPFCCGETWLALVNRLQHTPLSAQVSSQALRFLSPRASPQPLRGETTTTSNSLPSSASSSEKPLSL